jgi:hypothetical protein
MAMITLSITRGPFFSKLVDASRDRFDHRPTASLLRGEADGDDKLEAVESCR